MHYQCAKWSLGSYDSLFVVHPVSLSGTGDYLNDFVVNIFVSLYDIYDVQFVNLHLYFDIQ